MRVLVTGANGFVGNRLCRLLTEHGYEVCAALRHLHSNDDHITQEQFVVGNISHETEWIDALKNIDYVIHLAARVHVMKEAVKDPLAAFRLVNTAGTVRLAEQAAAQGVKRFVFMSSIKVNGEETCKHPLSVVDAPDPRDPYGISKAEAEAKLQEISARKGLDVVIIRPPLIYGAGVGGNMLRLIQLVEHSVPLPLASIQNSRSMVSLNNITDLLVRCLKHPGAAGETFLVSDGVEWSTPELLRCIARTMGVPTRLFPFPPAILKLVGRITGQAGVVNRLCDSLEVDISKTCELLEWAPIELPEEGIQQAVDWYLKCKRRFRC